MKKNFIRFAEKVRSASEKESKGSMLDKISVVFLYAFVVVIMLTCLVISVTSEKNTHFDYTEVEQTTAPSTTVNAVSDASQTTAVTEETTDITQTTADIF